MRVKKLAVIIIAIVFSLVMLVSCIALFSVKKINVNFAVGEKTDTLSVQNHLEEYIGKNLLFLDTEEVEQSLQDFYYMEVLSVEKEFPNVINVNVKERREVYDIVSNGTVYVTTDSGFVLNSFADLGAENSSRDKIRIELDGVSVEDATLGKVITTNDNAFLSEVFKMAKSVNLINCIESIKLEKAVEWQNAYFYTYTGVKILITNVLEDGLGVDRIKVAFDKYDEGATDFQKTFQTIVAVQQFDEKTGEYLGIRATFTE